MLNDAVWRLAAAVVGAYAIAALVPLLKRLLPQSVAGWIGWLLAPAIWASVLLIPPDRIGLRALAAFLVNEVALKVVDYFRRDRTEGLREYFWFLIPFPTLAVVFPDHKRRLARPDDSWLHVLRIVLGLLGILIGVLVLIVARQVGVLRSNFWLDHLVKAVFFISTIESISQVLFAIERLAGFRTTPVIQNAFLSRTPAEFWRRYNVRVHDWMLRNVFRAAGGGRAPIRGVVMVFVFSGLLHELMFGVATSVFDGAQLLFFLLQIPAVLISGPLERFAQRKGALGRITAHAITILFLASTSVLFFKGMSRVFPIVYASPSPW
jgi:hypothetical protein